MGDRKTIQLSIIVQSDKHPELAPGHYEGSRVNAEAAEAKASQLPFHCGKEFRGPLYCEFP